MIQRKKEKKKKLSLREAYPSLAKEWHPEKNDILTPDDVTPADYIHAWWICHLKHEWIAAVKDRVDGAGCPHCPGVSNRFDRRVTLASVQPEAVKFWHPEKNGGRTPDQFAQKSNIKVWWKCENGHEWYAPIYSMRINPRCPYCHPGLGASHKHNLAVKNPELASQWHPTKNGTLLPSHLTPFSSKKVWWKCSKGHEWIASIAYRQLRIGCPLCSKRSDKNYNLANIAPQVVPFWHPTKNGDRTPADFLPGSGKKVWWICEKGHEWQRSISYMRKNQNCPVCSKRELLKKNNLQVRNPQLAREWHPVKNGDLTPDKIMSCSAIKVWWICPKGHEYQASLANRNRRDGKGRGCPYCAGRKDISKENLAIFRPDLAKEWHPEKNGDLTPDQVHTGSTRRVWWRCKNGHEWIAAVKDRVDVAGCPHCPGFSRNLTGRVTLASAQPEAVKFWHPEKNGDRTPDQFAQKSRIKVWWKCGNGHEWYAEIRSMRINPHCPYCYPAVRTSQHHNLAVKRPDLARQWHPTKNGTLLPTQVTQSSAIKVWWQCSKGHEFKRVISHMRKVQKCPVCRQLAFNLQDKNPELAREWHPVKNGDLTPEKIKPSARIKVWWLCPRGHEYQAVVASRVYGRSRGCPYCAGRKDLSKESLAVLRPDLAKEWHPEKNGNLTPDQIHIGSKQVVWWRCKYGHEWQAAVYRRVKVYKYMQGKRSPECPQCYPMS